MYMISWEIEYVKYRKKTTDYVDMNMMVKAGPGQAFRAMDHIKYC